MVALHITPLHCGSTEPDDAPLPLPKIAPTFTLGECVQIVFGAAGPRGQVRTEECEDALDVGRLIAVSNWFAE